MMQYSYHALPRGPNNTYMSHFSLLFTSPSTAVTYRTNSQGFKKSNDYEWCKLKTKYYMHIVTNYFKFSEFLIITVITQPGQAWRFSVSVCRIWFVNYRLNHSSSLSTGCSPAGFSIPGSVLHTGLAEARLALPEGGLARVWAGGRLEGRAGARSVPSNILFVIQAGHMVCNTR